MDIIDSLLIADIVMMVGIAAPIVAWLCREAA
jgi:hypothetical protein